MEETLKVDESPKNGYSIIAPYSYGIVAANKDLDSDEIEVTSVKDLPMLNGELSGSGSRITGKGTDQLGSSYEANANVAVTIRAKWLKLSQGNRITSPDVRRGAEVLIWRVADADEYWWTTLGDDKDLRKLETVVFAFSGTKEENVKMDSSNSYFLEISTHRKIITLSTSQANEEPFGYTLQLNTGEGTFSLTDNIDNYWHLNSAEHLWRVQNADGTFAELNKKDYNVYAVENINMRAGKNVSISAGENLATNAGKDSTFTSSNNSTTVATINTSDAPQTVVAGNLSTKPGRGGTNGSGVLNGSFEVLGSMNARQNLTADGMIQGNQVKSILAFIGPNVN